MDVADPRERRARVYDLYLLPRGVYRAKAIMPRSREGGRGFYRYEPVAPSAGPYKVPGRR